jgi:hypothetical protein
MSDLLSSSSRVINFKKQLFIDQNLHVYTVLDGASVSNLLQKLQSYQAESACLYRGELDPELAAVAPYLVLLPPDAEITDWVLNGVGHHWGIFALSKTDMRTMRRHFRTFLMVNTPDGNPVYFRYYDPRVLRTFLPTCNAEEIKQVFGAVEVYYTENEVADELLRFLPTDNFAEKNVEVV